MCVFADTYIDKHIFIYEHQKNDYPESNSSQLTEKLKKKSTLNPSSCDEH